MKLSGSVFSIVFATSWLGNFLLTGLGFFLAFTQAEPLTMGLFATVAGCILSGNTLPIAAYGLFLYGQRTRIQAEQSQASVTVRESLRRSETVLQRLEAAEGAIAKSLLLARQLPDKLLQAQEAQEEVLTAMDAFDPAQLAEMVARLEALRAVREEEEAGLSERLESLEASVKAVGADLQAMDKRLGALVEAPHGERSEDDTGVLERLDLLQEALEGVEHTLDGLLLAVRPKPEQAPIDSGPSPLSEEPAEQAETVESIPMNPDPEGVEAPEEAELREPPSDDEAPLEFAGTGEKEADEPEALVPVEAPIPDAVAVEEPLVFDPAEEPVRVAEEPPVEKPAPLPELKAKPEKAPREKAASRRTVAPENQFEMGFEDFGETAGPKARADQVILRVKSMVGIQNKVFIRGDEPHLSWEAGQRMDVVGIGEFIIEFDGVSEPFGAAFWLNDEVEADSGPVRLEPGQRYELAVRFRR